MSKKKQCSILFFFEKKRVTECQSGLRIKVGAKNYRDLDLRGEN
jgi:hypothetical protein